jgi:hypothetical protein
MTRLTRIRFVAWITSGRSRAPAATIYVRRTYSGRPRCGLAKATAMATSVVCRSLVRERSASPITCQGDACLQRLDGRLGASIGSEARARATRGLGKKDCAARLDRSEELQQVRRSGRSGFRDDRATHRSRIIIN